MKKYSLFLILAQIPLFFLTFPAKAQVDPAIQWKVLHLPHFELIYDAKHQELANIYADRLEDNLRFLNQYFEFIPKKTTVVLNDRSDLTNGYATPIPYRTIVSFPVLPGPLDTVGDYGDWARELTMHEYTHMLSFEPRRGLVKGLYYTFGSFITPNLFLPRWWLEGIAVDMETRTSEKGRLRSVFQDASIRAYAQDHSLSNLKLEEINETSIHTWPQGGRPYLFGSLMWSEMISRYGKDVIRQLHSSYGGRVPYFLDGPLNEATGVGYSKLFDQMKNSLQEKVLTQMTVLQKVPLSQGTPLTFKNAVESFSPTISPDGLKMAFLTKDDTNKRSVKILIRPSLSVPFEGSQIQGEVNQDISESLGELNPTPKKMEYLSGIRQMRGIDESEDENHSSDGPPGGTIHRLSWLPDSKGFVFDKLDEVNRFHEDSDLWIYDLTSKKAVQLTFAERAREASISPDGSLAAYVKLDAGTTYLGTLNLETKKTEVIYRPAQIQVRISYPVFLNNHEILFSERINGTESFKILNLQTRLSRIVLADYPNPLLANMSSKGLIFSSTKNGTANTYLASADLKTAKPLTHSGTMMALSALDSSRHELYASELSSKGFQIRRLTQAQMNSLPTQLPVISPLLQDRYPAVVDTVTPLEKPAPDNYSIWPYILPHYWFPNFYFTNGNSLIGASTSGSDPLAKHSYSLAASYETAPKETNINFIYANNQTPAMILAKAFDYNTNVINTSTHLRIQQYEVDSLWQITPLSTDLYAGLGWTWLARQYSFVRKEAQGPTLLMNYMDYTMSGAQVTPVRGQSVTLAVTSFLKSNAVENESFNLYQYTAQKYFSKWLPRHHAIMLRLQGQHIDETVSPANYAFTVPYSTFPNAPSPFYIMRGYLNGQFLGKTLANYTFEYRFPIAYPYAGGGTAPFFLKKIHAALIADGINVDGVSYNKSLETYERVDRNKGFWSAGAELKADVTIGYHFPVTLLIGYYWPLDTRYREAQQFAIGLQL